MTEFNVEVEVRYGDRIKLEKWPFIETEVKKIAHRI